MNDNNENENYINPVEISKPAPKSNFKMGIIIGSIVALLCIGVIFAKSYKLIAAQFSPKAYLTYVLPRTGMELASENATISKSLESAFPTVDFKNINSSTITLQAPSIPNVSGGVVYDTKTGLMHLSTTLKDITTFDMYEDGSKGIISLTGSHKYAFPLKTFGDGLTKWVTGNFGVDPTQVASFQGMDLSYSPSSMSNYDSKSITDLKNRLSKDFYTLIANSTLTMTTDKDTAGVKGLPVVTKK